MPIEWSTKGLLVLIRRQSPSAIYLLRLLQRHGYIFSAILESQKRFSYIKLPLMLQTLKKLYKFLDIRSFQTSVYHPQTNGLVEHFNKMPKTMICTFVSTNIQFPSDSIKPNAPRLNCDGGGVWHVGSVYRKGSSAIQGPHLQVKLAHTWTMFWISPGVYKVPPTSFHSRWLRPGTVVRDAELCWKQEKLQSWKAIVWFVLFCLYYYLDPVRMKGEGFLYIFRLWLSLSSRILQL